MRKIANSSSLLAIAMTIGLSAAGWAQDQNTNPPNTNSAQSSSQSSSTTSSNTDQSTQTDSAAQQTRSTTSDQTSTDTDVKGTKTTTHTTSQDSSSRTVRNRTIDTDKSMIGDRDRRFLTKAAEGGLMEVQMAQMAQRQASSQAVKDFARQLEQDHSNANKQLMDIATQRNISLPTTPMASDHQQTMDRLTKLSGADFDKQYIRTMIRDHRKDIREFENESNSGMDSSLKNFASSTLPTLRNHLQMAEQIDRGGTATSMNNATSTTTTTVSESSRSRGKGATVVEEDKTTINKVTPAPASVTTTEVDRTTTSPDGAVRQDKTTVNKVTSKP